MRGKSRDIGLDNLLALDGTIVALDEHYFVKFEVRAVKQTAYRPHGIKYSLTLHNAHGT